MKKKLLTFLLTGVMALSCSSFAMAAETEIDLDEVLSQMEDVQVTEETTSWSSITWDDVQQFMEKDENLAKGSFVEDETLGMKFYLPDFMEELELEEADKADGMYRFFWNGDDASFFIMENPKDELGVKDVVEYEKVIEETGEYDPMLLNVNGIDTLCYFITSEDEETPNVMSIAYIPEDGDKIIEFYCTPGDADGEYVDLFRVIVGSLQMMDK